MIDEYQDTNRPQYLLVKQLVSVHGNLCVVGDPDQSIYKWRGADLRNILDFEHDFPDAVTVKLERNYRSTQVILDAASAVVSRQPRPQGQGAVDRPGRRRADCHLPRRRRARRGRLHRPGRAQGPGRRRRDRPPPCSIAPTRSRARWKTACGQAGIPYAVLGGTGFYERKEIKDALAYLKLVLNPARRRGAAPRDQRAAAGHRQGGDGGARERRSHGPGHRRAAAAGRARRRGSRDVAVGQARHRGDARPAGGPAGQPARRLSRDAARGHRRGRRQAGVHGARTAARSQRLPARAARGAQRGGRRAHREPDGAGVGGARVRGGRPGVRTDRVRGSPGAALGRGQAGRAAGPRECC